MKEPLPQNGAMREASAVAGGRRSYRYYDFTMAAFVTVLICSNLIGAGKVCRFELGRLIAGAPALTFGAGNIFFPISYIFGDILTEVYGYARSRKVIWAGFGALAFAAVMGAVVVHLPADPGEPYNAQLQPAIETVFGNTWRIVAASMLAYWAGDFLNSYILARMKVLTRGRFLWMRTIGSTIAGQALDSVIFYPIAFSGLWTTHKMAQVVVFNCFFKVTVEVLFTPLTYLVVNRLKRAEREDYYDVATNFSPFTLKD